MPSSLPSYSDSERPSCQPTVAPTPLTFKPTYAPTVSNSVLCELLQLSTDSCSSDSPNAAGVCSTSAHNVSCDESGNVIKIDMAGKGYVGELPSNIGSLKHCEDLNIRENSIQSPLPDSFSSLVNLKRLDISFNNLGTLAINSTSSRRLAAGNVETFSTLAKLTSLEFLDISSNGMHGIVPEDLCQLPNLKTLHLSQPEGAEALPYQDNNFTCIAQCLYFNSSRINITHHKSLSYCGQTLSPSSSPTFEDISQLSSAESLGVAETSGIVVGLVVFLTALIGIYYFMCYSNTSMKEKDRNIVYESSYIDIDKLRKDKSHQSPSMAMFERDSFEHNDSYVFGESDSNEGNPESDGNSFITEDQEDEALQEWNSELKDFYKNNPGLSRAFSNVSSRDVLQLDIDFEVDNSEEDKESNGFNLMQQSSDEREFDLHDDSRSSRADSYLSHDGGIDYDSHAFSNRLSDGDDDSYARSDSTDSLSENPDNLFETRDKSS